MSNNQLPDDVRERIKADAAKSTNKRNESLRYQAKDYGRRISFIDGYEQGYVAGATTEVVKLHEAQQENKTLCSHRAFDKNYIEALIKKKKAAHDLLEEVLHHIEGHEDAIPNNELLNDIKRFLYGE